jgi:hypothetical protein
LFTAILLIAVLSCKNGTIKKEGYIVMGIPGYFFFVPVKKMDLKTNTSSFYSENLEKGFQFSTYNQFAGILLNSIDTVKVINIDKYVPFPYEFINIVPVKIEMRKIPDEKQRKGFSQEHSFKTNIGGKIIELTFDFREYELLNVIPLKTERKGVLSLKDKKIWNQYDSLFNPIYKH